MTPVFADAVYLVALANPRDQFHSKAVAIDMADRLVITTQYVITEVGNALAKRSLRNMFGKLVDRIADWNDVTIRPGSDDLFAAALDLYRRRPDKDWSLTDCTSFVVMEREGLRDALTADHHFEQAGFVALLK